ncbi:hypothetical protein B7P43_G02402 [Cryptotermes secundus]|uniref:Uncharacterized protein n=1 Tax=Cryptotermes secundus TaxID=105785 RepID=A0A2J7R429_9NEOP|nr:hypothetical protein B7P43_G02402 [Cryptotermes secundus]
MHCVAAKFVPCLLIDEQEVNHVTVSQDRSNADENFLKNIVTGDEKWAYRYDIKKRLNRCIGWENQSRSNVQVLFIFFYGKGIVQQEFVPRSQRVNGQFYLEVMKCLREAERRKRPKG